MRNKMDLINIYVILCYIPGIPLGPIGPIGP